MRKKLSGQGALSTFGDGWANMVKRPETLGPFDSDPTPDGDEPINYHRVAAVAVEKVQRQTT